MGFPLCLPREVTRATSASCLHHGVLEPWGPPAGRQGQPSDTHTAGRLPCRPPQREPRVHRALTHTRTGRFCGGGGQSGGVSPGPGYLPQVPTAVAASAACVLSGGSGGSQLTPFIAQGGSGRPPDRPPAPPSLRCLPPRQHQRRSLFPFFFFLNSHQCRGIVPPGLRNFIWAEWFKAH